MSTRSRHGDGSRIKQGEAFESPSPVLTLSLLCAFLVLPMLAIPIALFSLVYLRKVDFSNSGSAHLPVSNMVPTNNYYTTVTAGQFALVSSWASTVEGHITAPFLILLSFVVAWSLNRNSEQQPLHQQKRKTHTEKQIRVLLQSRTFLKLWRWIKVLLPRHARANATHKATIVAAFGLTLTLVFSLLIVVGDNLLHATVNSQTYRYYNDTISPKLNESSEDANDPNSALFSYAAGYTMSHSCDGFLNGSSPMPCSLTTSPFYNIENPSSAYLVLQAGISETSNDFSGINFTQSIHDQNSYTSSSSQVITYLDPVTNSNHSFLFYVDATAQYSDPQDNLFNFGYDFFAPSFSMQTTCELSSSACDITTNSSLFNCSNIFSGNLSVDSLDGRLRIPGWDTSFYTIGSDGAAQELGLAEEQNPFRYNVTVQVDAITDALASILNHPSSENPSALKLPDQLIPTGNGSVGFALSCSSTVYTIAYSVINQTISSLEPTLADPKIASIIRAPLQVGYGRYNLYQAAITGVIRWVAGGESLDSTLARTFSEVGIALSSGAFAYTTNIEQRERFDLVVTVVPRGPVWFLAAVCLLYALVGTLVFAGALVARRDEDVRHTQQRLGLESAQNVIDENLAAYESVTHDEMGSDDEGRTVKPAKRS